MMKMLRFLGSSSGRDTSPRSNPQNPRSVTSSPAPSPSITPGSVGPARPLRLVYCDEKGKFRMDPEAVATLQLVKGPIGVDSVCGRDRQGKSFILNQVSSPFSTFLSICTIFLNSRVVIHVLQIAVLLPPLLLWRWHGRPHPHWTPSRHRWELVPRARARTNTWFGSRAREGPPAALSPSPSPSPSATIPLSSLSVSLAYLASVDRVAGSEISAEGRLGRRGGRGSRAWRELRLGRRGGWDGEGADAAPFLRPARYGHGGAACRVR